jgi:hypothetical protein
MGFFIGKPYEYAVIFFAASLGNDSHRLPIVILKPLHVLHIDGDTKGSDGARVKGEVLEIQIAIESVRFLVGIDINFHSLGDYG